MIRRCTVLLVLLLGLAAASAQSRPPVEEGRFRQPELVEIIRLDPSIKLDIRYASKNNFVGEVVYERALAFLQRPAAEALVRAHRKAKTHGYGFIVFDAYRPWDVTRLFWDRFPNFRPYLADPANGSRHNRGCAVDLSLFDLVTGYEIQMPSGYDDFSERAHPTFQGGTADQRKARDLLRTIMESEGFRVYENEWWHFDCKQWREYPIMNIPFSHVGT